MAREYNTQLITEGSPIEEFRRGLLLWWNCSKRSFPWRETRDPYKILVAEILLHRTRADQVVPLYISFIERYPTIQTLTKSTPDEIAKVFHSAGLHWRWKLLYIMAVDLEEKFHNQIPQDFNSLASLPGISHYIASAVRCFAFGHPEAILDTNTVRVVGRLLALPVTDSSRRSILFKILLQNLVDLDRPREFNFALIDFAAIICRAKTPRHVDCPLRIYCRGYAQTTSI